jgi:hypothetical protein
LRLAWTNCSETCPHLNQYLGTVVCACHPKLYETRMIVVPGSLGTKQDPVSKITRAKRAGGMD